MPLSLPLDARNMRAWSAAESSDDPSSTRRAFAARRGRRVAMGAAFAGLLLGGGGVAVDLLYTNTLMMWLFGGMAVIWGLLIIVAAYQLRQIGASRPDYRALRALHLSSSIGSALAFLVLIGPSLFYLVVYCDLPSDEGKLWLYVLLGAQAGPLLIGGLAIRSNQKWIQEIGRIKPSRRVAGGLALAPQARRRSSTSTAPPPYSGPPSPATPLPPPSRSSSSRPASSRSSKYMPVDVSSETDTDGDDSSGDDRATSKPVTTARRSKPTKEAAAYIQGHDEHPPSLTPVRWYYGDRGALPSQQRRPSSTDPASTTYRAYSPSAVDPKTADYPHGVGWRPPKPPSAPKDRGPTRSDTSDDPHLRRKPVPSRRSLPADDQLRKSERKLTRSATKEPHDDERRTKQGDELWLDGP